MTKTVIDAVADAIYQEATIGTTRGMCTTMAQKVIAAVMTEGYDFVLRVGSSTERVVSVPDALSSLGAIYRERNAVYGDTYKNFGGVMRGFFPNQVTLATAEEWNRMALFFHCADKLARYAGAFKAGGHVDSLDDNSVYSQMLQEYDALLRHALRIATKSSDEVAR